MIVGELTLGTCYGEMVFKVEILNIGPRPGTVCVKALDGLRPFPKMSHGGPFQDDTALWNFRYLRNVHKEEDETTVDEAQPAPEVHHKPEPDRDLEKTYTGCTPHRRGREV